jgi:hypothetical protein
MALSPAPQQVTDTGQRENATHHGPFHADQGTHPEAQGDEYEGKEQRAANVSDGRPGADSGRSRH